MKKKDRFNYNGKIYEVAGKWEDSIVLAPVGDQDDQCLIYLPVEIKDLLKTGQLSRTKDKPQKARKTKRALFARKVANLEDLKELTARALAEGKTGENYRVTSEVELSEAEFRRFTEDFFRDQPWIDPKAGCIRVVNKETRETVLIDPQGYTYPRYTALELKE
jgi:hypothetical protein